LPSRAAQIPLRPARDDAGNINPIRDLNRSVGDVDAIEVEAAGLLGLAIVFELGQVAAGFVGVVFVELELAREFRVGVVVGLEVEVVLVVVGVELAVFNVGAQGQLRAEEVDVLEEEGPLEVAVFLLVEQARESVLAALRAVGLTVPRAVDGGATGGHSEHEQRDNEMWRRRRLHGALRVVPR
jgi:hypothetical protein